MKKLFFINLILISISATGFANSPLPPVPKSELCAEPTSQTEAAKECSDCFADSALNISKNLAELAAVGETLSDTTEKDATLRLARTAWVLRNKYERSHASLDSAIRLQRIHEKLAKKEIPDPADTEFVKQYIPEDDYKKILNSKYILRDSVDSILSKVFENKYNELESMSIEDLQKYIDESLKYFEPFSFGGQHFNLLGVCGLSELEFISIRAYTARFYEVINEELRTLPADSAANKRNMAYIKTIRSAFAKLKTKPQVTYRTMVLYPQFFEDYKEGQTITSNAFMSASRDRTYVDRSQVGVEIYSKTGKYIAPFSEHPDEEEILFLPGTKFKVLKVFQVKDKRWQVQLEEI